MKASHYWDGIIRGWLADDRDALWRRYSDALHVSLFRHWLGEVPSETLLKTDLFDEAVSEGLNTLWPEHGLAVGIDISPEIALAVRRRHPHWHVLVADVRRLPFADGAFDTIFSNSTLDHFEAVSEIHQALGELHRILRPGGKLLLTLDNAANPIIALRQALPARLLQRLGLVPYAMGVTVGPDRLKKMLEATSFTVLEMLPVLHCPRFFAVQRARKMKHAPAGQKERFLRNLGRWEALGSLPTRWLTGYFIAIFARKEAH